MGEVAKKVEESSKVLGEVFGKIAKEIKPGMTGVQLDKIAEDFMVEKGGKPAFKGYRGFPATLCISVNSEIVHGIPKDVEFKEGDIISIDCGTIVNGYYGDSAFTFTLGEIADEASDIIVATYNSLMEGIPFVKTGNRIGDWGNYVETYCKSHGYSVVRELVGHGVGKQLHENPNVPNFGRKGSGKKFKKGMVIALEPMVNQGTHEVLTDSDGWTVVTKDGKLSAHFEHIVEVCDGPPKILTTYDYIFDSFKTNPWLSKHPLNKTA